MKRLAFLVPLLFVGLTAQAQETASYSEVYSDEVKWKLAAMQLVASLESPIPAVRTQSLRNAIIYAVLYRDKIDLSGTVGALRTVYEDDPRREHRVLALAALQAIGTIRAVDYLARRVPEADVASGRLMMAEVLSGYYTTHAPAAAL